jgi:proteic killer suppression protein
VRFAPAGSMNAAKGAVAIFTLSVKRAILKWVIESFRCPDTERLFRRERVARFVNIESAARRRLDALHVAAALRDLLARPSNRLEALKRDRRGQHSIRINDRYRICFRWREGSAYDVEIVDYH